MNTKNFTLSTLAVVLLIFSTSCNKIKDALAQDVSITPGAVDFNIPVIASTNSGTVLANIAVDLDLNALIKEKASKFDASNVKNVKITGVKFDLLDADDANNFANLENVSAAIEASGQAATVLASISGNPDVKSTTLTVPITGGGVELKSFLTSGGLKYTLTGKARRVTTKVLKARATFSYTFTLKP
jgi:hypothetical protein